jgi:hypothetical protein
MGLQIPKIDCLYYPLTTQFYPQRISFSYNYPNPPTLFPSTCIAQRMGSPFTAHSPSSIATSLQGSNTSWLGISLTGDSKDIDCNRKSSQQQAHLLLDKLLHKISLYMPNNLLLHEFIAPTATTHAHYGFLQAPSLCIPLLSQKVHVKYYSLFPYKIFFSHAC